MCMAYNTRIPAHRFTLFKNPGGSAPISGVRGPAPLVLEVLGVWNTMRFPSLLAEERRDDDFFPGSHKAWAASVHTY